MSWRKWSDKGTDVPMHANTSSSQVPLGFVLLLWFFFSWRSNIHLKVSQLTCWKTDFTCFEGEPESDCFIAWERNTKVKPLKRGLYGKMDVSLRAVSLVFRYVWLPPGNVKKCFWDRGTGFLTLRGSLKCTSGKESRSSLSFPRNLQQKIKRSNNRE